MWDGLATLMMGLAGLGLTWLVQATVLLALGLLAGRLLRRSGPAVLSGVYRTTLAAVLICPVASAALLGAGVEGLALRWPGPVKEAANEPKLPMVSLPVVVASEPHRRDERSLEPAPRARENLSSVVATRRVPRVLPPSRPSPRLTRAGAAAVGLVVWSLGSMVVGLRLWVGLIRMRRVRGSAAPAEPDASALCRDVARRMNVGVPTVWRSPFLFSPCLDGLRRPAILLPDDVDENLSDIFVHELAHLVRRDGLWNLLRRSAAVVLWVHPLFWVLTRRLEAAAEEVCDDYVVQFGGDRARYAGHLLELAGRALPPVAPAAVGMISLRSMLARRVVRILDTSRTLSTRAGTRPVLGMLAVGLVGTVGAGLLGVDGGEREARAQGTEPATQARSTSGNEPIRVAADEPVEPAPTKPAQADVPINGRIVDLEGRPVAGVSVKLGDVRGAKSGDLSPWIEKVRNGEPPWIAYRQINEEIKLPESVRREVATDADGRFRFEGLGAERVAALTIQGDAVAYTTIDVVTRRIESFPARGFPDTHGPGAQTVYGADFTYTASPSRPIEGVVRDAKSKRPLPGVSVESWQFAGSNFVDTRQLKALTDESGRFRIVGMPKGKGNALIAVPNDDQPYLMREAAVGDPAGIAPVVVEIELHRGVMITGKITDKVTGQPVEEARLHYMPFLDNPYAQALPEFANNGHVDGFQERYTTRADGTYRLVGVPGRAIVGVESVGKTPYRMGAGSETIEGLDKNGLYKTWYNPIWPGRGWPNTLVEINPAEGAETLDLDAALDPGLSLRIQVVDADGNAVPDATVEGRNRIRVTEGTPDALFEVGSFRPDEVRNVVICQEGRNLGKVVRLRAGDDAEKPVVVTLAPMASIKGRAVDSDGNPVAAATVRVDVEPTAFFAHTLTNVAADRDGRFEVLKVPAGCEYGLVVEARTRNKQRPVGFGKATVKPGETTDVGTITLKSN